MRRLQEAGAAGFDAAALERARTGIEAANGTAFRDGVAVVAVSERGTDEAPDGILRRDHEPNLWTVTA